MTAPAPAPAFAGSAAEEVVRRIIADVTLKPAYSFGLDDDLPKLLSLDSLSLLRVVADIEETFGVHVHDEEFQRLRTLRELLGTVG